MGEGGRTDQASLSKSIIITIIISIIIIILITVQIRQAFQTSSLPPPSSAAIYINSLRHTWTIRVKVKVKSGINSIVVYHQFWVTIDTRGIIRMYKGCRSQVPPVGQNRSALTSTTIILARVQYSSILSIGQINKGMEIAIMIF